MTETTQAPAWAHGHDVATLKQVAKFFNDFEQGYTYGAFSHVSDLDVVSWLDKDQLHQEEHWAVVLQRVRTRQQVKDFAGHLRAYYQPGDLVVKRAAWLVDGAQLALWSYVVEQAHALAAERIWLELLHEVPALNQWLQYLLPQHVCTRVKSSSELLGVYVRQGEHEGGLFDMPVEIAQVDALEENGLTQLPLHDLPVRDELLAAIAELGMAGHYSSYQRTGTWSALALRGYGPPGGYPDKDFIAKPGEMSKKWRAENPEKLDWTPGWTRLYETLAPLVDPLLSVLPGVPDRVRFMRLEPGGGELTRHADLDKDAGVADGKLLRIHIPLVTNEGVQFDQWLLGGQLQQGVHMPAASAWYLDQRKPHRAVNGGTTPRVHLVADMYGNDALRALLRAGVQAPTA